MWSRRICSAPPASNFTLMPVMLRDDGCNVDANPLPEATGGDSFTYVHPMSKACADAQVTP